MTFAGRKVALLFIAAMLGGCNTLLGIHEPREADAGTDGPDIEVAEDADDGDAELDAPSPTPDASPDGPVDDGPTEVEPDAGGETDAPTDGGMDGPSDAPTGPDADAMNDADPDGPGPDKPPMVVIIGTTTLPGALYNVAYSVQLVATGGNGTDLLWSISSGRLPTGVDLDGAGELHGAPRESGPFDFEVTVSDRAGASTTQRLVLNVIRKRWLIFLANTNNDDWSRYGLFAVDVRSPGVKLTVSSNIRLDSGTVGKYAFSPDGAFVAFLGEAVADVPQLYVVDMRDDVPGAPRKVNESGKVRDFAWAPDSKSLAYSVEDEETLDLIVSDVTLPAVPGERIGNPPRYVYAMAFVTPGLLTYYSDTIGFSRRGADGHFEAPASLLTHGEVVQRWPALESALFAPIGRSCMAPGWSLVDFDAPIMTRQLDGYVSAAPGRDYLAHRASDDYKYRIFSTWSETALAEFPTDMRFCSPGSWSHDGRMFVTAANDGKLLVTRVQAATATTATLAGSYGALAQNGPPVFSADDRWLGFSTEDGAYVVSNDHGSLGAPVGGGMPVSAPFGWPLIRFAPNASRLATAEPSSAGRSCNVTLVDLTKPTPTTTRLRFPVERAGSGVPNLGWSAHSTELALLLQEGTPPAPTNIYLLGSTDLANGGSGQNLSRFDGCSDGMCQQVLSFEFQP